jgi:hypothetical protein
MTAKPTLLPIQENNSKQNSQVLARVYSFILSWPDPPNKKAEPAAGDLSGDAVAGSENSFINLYTPKSSCEPDE